MAGMSTPFPSNCGAPVSTASTTSYMPVVAGSQVLAWQTTETDIEIPISVAGTIDLLQISNGISITSGSYTFTFRKNATDTALVCVLTGSVNSVTDSTHSFTVSPGDLVSIKCVSGSGTNTAMNRCNFGWRFTSNSANKSMIMGCTVGTKRSASYVMPLAGYSAPSATVTNSSVWAPMPIPGSVKSLYVSLSDALNGSATFTLDQNNTSSSLSFSMSSGTAGNTTGSVAISTGDLLNLSMAAGTNTTAFQFGWSVEFDPTSNGYSVGLISDFSLANGAVSYRDVNGNGGSSTLTVNFGLCCPCVVSLASSSVNIGTVNGSAVSVTVFQNLSASSVSAVMPSLSTFYQDTTDSSTFALGDSINVKFSNTDGNSHQMQGSLAFYIAPQQAYSAALGTGAFSFTGGALTASVSRNANLGTGVFSLSGKAMTATVARNAALGTGIYTLSGKPLTMTVTGGGPFSSTTFGSIESGGGTLTNLAGGTGYTIIPKLTNRERSMWGMIIHATGTQPFNVDYMFTPDNGTTWIVGNQESAVAVTADGGLSYTYEVTYEYSVGFQFRFDLFNTSGSTGNFLWENRYTETNLRGP